MEHEEALAAAGADVRAREPLQVAGDPGLGIARGGDVAFAGEERLDPPPPDRLGQHGGAPRDRFEGGVGPRVLRAIFPQKQSGGAGFRGICAREAAGSLPLAVGRVSLPPMSPATVDSPDAAPALRRYLEAMPRFVRERGSDYARRGRVESVARRSEREVEGAVRGERLYTVRLQRAGNHWMGVCTCPLGSRCKHLHALGLAWLGKLAPEPVAPPTGNELPAEREALLLREFTAGRTAPLAPADERLARKILRVFLQLERNGRLQTRDLAPLRELPGWERVGRGWQALDGWARPPTPREFWPQLAADLQAAGTPLPDFLRHAAEPGPAPVRGAEEQRRAAVARWRERLAPAASPAQGPMPGTMPTGPLRVRVGPGTFALESCPPEGGKWRNAWRTVVTTGGAERWLETDLDAPSAVLLALLRRHVVDFDRANPSLGQRQEATWLHAVLRHPRARELVTDAAGRPLHFAPEPLRRRLLAPEPGETDYRLILEDAAGRPVPPSALHLPGNPAYYLLDAVVHEGPPALDGASAAAALIPPAVAEDPAMLLAFRDAAVALPPALGARMETVALGARVECRLGTALVGGERLVLRILALAERPPVRNDWTPQGWRALAPPPAAGDRLFALDASLPELVVRQTVALGLFFDPVEQAWTCRLGPDLPGRLALWRERLPRDVEVGADPEVQGILTGPVRARVEFDLSEAGEGRDWFDLALVLKPEDASLTRAELALLLRAGGKLVRLPGKGWRRLEVTVDAGAEAALAEAGLPAAGAGAAALEGDKVRLHALQLGRGAIAERLPAELAARLRARAEALKAPPLPPCPAGLRASLRPYQLEGFHFLAFLAANRLGALLADDMGLGKTLQALAWLLWLAERQPAGEPLRALVVCPKSVVGNWEAETARFAPSLATRRHEAGGDVESPPGPGILLANYTQLRLGAAAFAARHWHAVILDEAQLIKNPAARVAQAARALDADHRLILTGTPVENRLLDLWSLCAFALPGVLGSQAAFRRHHPAGDPGAPARLRARVRPFLLRRTKAQVAADLPPRTEKDLVVELEGEQARLYQAELKRARAQLLGAQTPAGLDRVRFNVLASLTRLRQICCHPGLADPALRGAPSAKLEALVEQLEELREEGHPVLVFSQFVEMLELLRERLAADRVPHLLLTGRTEERDALVRRFQESPEPLVFLLSLKAAGFGLNLTAASYVFLFDPWWNPAVEAQAIDRTHRIGQTEPVIAYRLVTRGTVEEKIRRLQAEKAALAGAVVPDGEAAAPLDLDTLREILA